MMKKTVFLTLMLVGMMACNGNAKKVTSSDEAATTTSSQQTEVSVDDYFKDGAVWHNGFEWYQIRKDGNVVAFIGGTLHEGGSCFGLRPNGNNRFALVPVQWSLDDGAGYEPSLSGMNLYGMKANDLSAELKNYDGAVALVIRHKTKGAQAVLLPANGNGIEALDRAIKADMALAYSGNWRSQTGEQYVLTTDQSYSFPDTNGSYTFEYEFETPSNIITLQDGSHWGVQVADGRMTLTQVRGDRDGETWGEVPGGKMIALTLMPDELLKWRFPFASTQPLTLGLLSNFSKEDLRIMRNEIMARHGYRFNSPDLQQRFSRIKGYSPVSDNSKVQLTALEQLNVEIIKVAEEQPND